MFIIRINRHTETGYRLVATVELSCAKPEQAHDEFQLFKERFTLPEYHLTLTRRTVSEPVLQTTDC